MGLISFIKEQQANKAAKIKELENQDAFSSVDLEIAEDAVYITHDGDRIKKVPGDTTIKEVLIDINNIRNIIISYFVNVKIPE